MQYSKISKYYFKTCISAVIRRLYIRSIVRGKAAPFAEFGDKLDVSIDETRLARIEKISFDVYNELEILIQAVENTTKETEDI